ncbi:unnamed protein product [Rhizophagus irregularis]|uniref:Actin-like ATPase domain-containing protein n=1 Tax=Rhizophagus irregularis TaxID=588596 RepID=A0A915YXG9_9GLOM|nr:unnamed protein product [Rhizophagus irregularis]
MIPIEYEPSVEDARVVIGIDFGTTFSGFSFAYIKPEKEKIEIVVNDNWLGIKGPMKTNTVLQYDEDYEDVIAWGAKALAGEPSKKAKNNQPRPVIKDEIKRYWSNIDFNHHVRIIVTVPSGFSEKTKSIMRQCLFDAGLIKRIGILSLQFTTEPEAAAIHCMSILKEHGLSTGAKYLIVDCGGGTVDLTVRKLLPDNKLGETTMRVKQAFEHKIKVAVPPRPVIAVVSGACEYGLDTKAVSTRVLKWTYGVLISPEWQPGDPPSRKDSNGRIDKFCLMAEKEVQVDVDKEFSKRLYPIFPNQTSISFPIYYTSKYSATYCDEPEMNFLGKFNVDLPDVHLGTNRPVMLTLHFGSMEIFLKATNETNSKVYRTTFCSTE